MWVQKMSESLQEFLHEFLQNATSQYKIQKIINKERVNNESG